MFEVTYTLKNFTTKYKRFIEFEKFFVLRLHITLVYMLHAYMAM